MNRPLDLVLERLRALDCCPKPTGKNWMARCPNHEDDTASLSVTEGDDGRALVHCHAGCPIEAVLKRLGLTMRDLFLDEGEGGPGIPSRDRATVQPHEGLTLAERLVIKYPGHPRSGRSGEFQR